MKNLKFNTFLIILLFVTFSTAGQQKLLVGGSGWGQVAVLDKNTGKIEWSHSLQKGDECNDIEATSEGNILLAYKRGAQLITKSHEIIWDFKIENGQELFTATQLPNGEYLLAACANPSRIILLNSKGKKIKELNFDFNIPSVHSQFRQITPTPDNTYIVPVIGKGEVIEINHNSEIIKRILVGGNPFSVKILPDGNWLVSCGDAHKFVVVDPKTETIVKTVSDTDIPEISFYFVAELHQLNNGNYIFANWNGHAKDKTSPKIIEIDADNKVVWTLPHNDKILNISTFHLLTK